MKYSININQLVLAETSLDIGDAAILDFLTFICNSRNEKVEAERIRDERGSCTWVDYGHLLRDMPLLKITDKPAISRRIQKIEQEAYITTRRVGNQRLYVLLMAKVDELLIKNNSSDDLKQQSRSFKTTDNNTRDNTTRIKSASPSGDALRSRSVQEYFTEAYSRSGGDVSSTMNHGALGRKSRRPPDEVPAQIGFRVEASTGEPMRDGVPGTAATGE